MADTEISVPVEVRDGLVRAAAAQGLSLDTYLARLARPHLTADGLAAQGERARQYLKEWNGYDPTDEELAEVDANLRRQLERIRRTR
ncbi:hypothetical protein BL253_37025 [Pseudofrankia asymbiotica]|uniref:Antitoxin n=1 Tax=Pseudofrankia asymbiotica TaxID=1834516 RepID=A0A1V2HZ91_9ACTN|nr:hypothetical protein BL253_37025 [Pseudofrankia asymbiotica]